MDPVFPFGKDTDLHPDVPSLSSAFPKLVGELLYLALLTRPDIAHTVMTLAQFSSKAELCHYAAVKRYNQSEDSLRGCLTIQILECLT
ncbi:hypothetical protein PAXRUDRAFT_778507 [Paxillus rubicundulus Ve08.2h10]|uniref:Uncharacterized protein n=1 Tax=Paxillus rubicundulus Ve08.2h10 TaxID=930991 RepID=A0A0D0DDH8_9AGAM|nr:hypothetical protein PAXRUDRAFT_778507 [Paxillus rubicundulus Ve08.2h10]